MYWLLHSIHVVVFVFQYKKPKEILILEQELLKELKKIKGPCEGDADCKTQWIPTVGTRETFCVAYKSEPYYFPFLSNTHISFKRLFRNVNSVLLTFFCFIYIIFCRSTYSINFFFQVSYVVTRVFAFADLQGSNFNWGHITCHPPRTDVLVKHSKDTMPHACSLRGHSYQPVPFVFTEYPHVARMYVMGHPGSRYSSLVNKLMLLFFFFSQTEWVCLWTF